MPIRIGMDSTRPNSSRHRFRQAFISLFSFILAGPVVLHAQNQSALSLDSLLNVPVSSATKHLQAVRDAPASVTIITAGDIERFGWSDLSQVLNSVGGFYSSYDRNYTYLGVRGFGRPTDYNNRLLLLINGHTINEGFWGSTAAGPDLALDLRSLSRIEVVRGPGSALYGNNAVFAVINLITKDGAELDGARVTGSAGSYGNYSGSLLAGTQLPSGLDVVVNGLYGYTDGQDLHFPELESDSATGGTIRGLDWEKRAGAFVQARHAGSGLSFMSRYVWREKAIPTASFDQIPGNPHAGTRDRWIFAQLALDRPLSSSLQLSARAYADFYRYEGDYAYEPLYTELADNRIAGGEAILRWDIGSRNRLTIGSEYRDNYRARYESPRTVDPPSLVFGSPYHMWSLFAQHEVDLAEWLTLVVGVRYDDHSWFGGHLSPRGAIVLHPDRATSLKLLYGEAFRAPSISEAENGGVAPVGGPALDAEEIHTLELVAQRQVSRGLLLTAGAFVYRMDGLIEQEFIPSDSVFEFRNSAGAVARGVYGAVEWHARSGTVLSLGTAFTRAKDDDSGERLTNSPSLLMKSGVSVPLVAGLGLGVQTRYESGRVTLAGTTTDDVVLADAYLHWRPPHPRSRVEAGLRVNNALDARWSTPGGVQHRQVAIAQDGRNVLLSLSLRF